MSQYYKPVIKVMIFIAGIVATINFILGNIVVIPKPPLLSSVDDITLFIVGVIITIISYVFHEEFMDYVAIPLGILGMYLVICGVSTTTNVIISTVVHS